MLRWLSWLFPALLFAQGHTTVLVADETFLAAMGSRIPAEFRVVPKAGLNAQALVDELASGSNLVWIGPAEGLPADLWIGSFRPARAQLRIAAAEHCPLPLDNIAFGKATVASAYIKPAKEMTYHNIDEEQRADFLPVLEARDGFGRVIGYPGALMRYSPSFVRRRFGGAECFFFFFDAAGESLEPDAWSGLLRGIAGHLRSGLQLSRTTTDYASFPAGERVRVSARIRNTTAQPLAAELRFYARAPGETQFREFDRHRRVPDGQSESEAVSDFIPKGRPGLWTIRVEARQDPAHAREVGIEGHPVPVDRRDIGVVVLNVPLRTPPLVSIHGPAIRIGGEEGFWTGTNYYPSSSRWEWLWRDLRPLEVHEDFAAMRRIGYRLVRIWIDPVLDTQTMRAMNAAVYLAAQHGIVLDVCLFTQWVRTIGFERHNSGRVRFDFRGPRDFNVYGISFRNLALQREYVRTLAREWRYAGNVIYNLSNETYIKDPDAGQMDPETRQWTGIPAANGILRDSLLFRKWADMITAAIRAEGGNQPIIPGYIFSEMGGGDAYIANRHGDIGVWHSYTNPERAAAALSTVDSGCSGRPLLLEEFGTQGWNHADYYDGLAHAALGAGAAGAMSYEWGVRWLAREMSFYALPLRESFGQEPDPRWFAPAVSLVKAWSPRSSGINPAPSGFFYGSIYHGTPFPAEAASALGRLGLAGRGLARAAVDESTYVRVGQASQSVPVLMQLRRNKVPFGVLQSDCIAKEGARIVTGVSQDLPRIPVEHGEGISLLTRRTAAGPLYTLIAEKPVSAVSVQLGKQKVRFGLDKYGLVQQGATGARMIEATGEVHLDDSLFAAIEGARAILSAEEGQSLAECRRLKVIAAGPAKIRFARPIRSVSVLEEGQSQPVGSVAPQGNLLSIDDELVRYVMRVELAR